MAEANGNTVNTNGANSNENTFEVSGISFKAPPFWRASPELWCKQVEAQFETIAIRSDSRKFYHVVAVIESKILTQVSDIIITPPTTDMYATLKKRIFDCFSESEDVRLKKLFKDFELGDKKPTHLLREMRKLSSGKLPDDVLKTLWLQRLPNQIKAILSASDDSLINLAAMADKISEVVDQKNDFMSISSVSKNSPSTEQSRITKLENQIENLSKKIEGLGRSRSRSRYNNNSNFQREKKRSKSRTRHELCWYHFKFGAKASKCVEPCNYENKSKN